MISITKSILLFSVFIILFFVYAYGNFLQIPIYQSIPLTLQQVFEPFFYILVFIIGNYLIFRSIYYRERTNNKNQNENLLITSFFLLFILGIGFGIHTASQLIEDMLGFQKDSLLYQIVFFLDEGPGHWLVSIPLVVLYFFLHKIELCRSETKIARLEKIILIICSLIGGIGLGISGFEGNFNGFAQHFLITPVVIGALYKVYKSQSFKFWTYPFTTFLVLVFWVYLVFVLVFGLLYGFTNDPEVKLDWLI